MSGVVKRLVSSRELGEVLGVTPWTVRKLARAGDVPSLRLTERGRWRFDLDQVLSKLGSPTGNERNPVNDESPATASRTPVKTVVPGDGDGPP
jgi:hypothetical protein